MNDSISIISRNVIEVRDALGLSQKKFSELLNISTATLVNIESGNKSFRFKSLDEITNKIDIPLSDLSKESFKPPKNLREGLLKRYEKDPSVFVILNSSPSIAYVLKYKILNTTFLNEPKETNEIKKFLNKNGFVFKGNSLHQTMKRLPSLFQIAKHITKKNTFVYSKNTSAK